MIEYGKIRDFMTDLVFPNRCPFCDSFIKWDLLCCGDCFNKIEWSEDGHTAVYKNENIFYDEYISVFYYSGAVKSAVIKLKTVNESNFPRIVAEKIASKVSQGNYKIDFIVPVPMGKRKLRKTGHNHSESLSAAISAALKVPVKKNCLFKHDSDISQHTMNAQERTVNVRGLFYKNDNESLNGKTVMVCDDVMTTGSTVSECARLLRELGASRIIAAVAAETLEYKNL